MGNRDRCNKIAVARADEKGKDLEGAIVKLHNIITGEQITGIHELLQIKLDNYLSWSYEEVITPLIAFDLKNSRNSSVRQLARRYDCKERRVYQIGLRIGVYGQNGVKSKSVLHG